MIIPFSAGASGGGIGRGLFGGGSGTQAIDYVTIASTGNATDFGDLLSVQDYIAGCSSATRGLFAGSSSGNWID